MHADPEIPNPSSDAIGVACDGLFAVGEDVMMEFSGGRLDGMKVLKSEWPKDQSWPGTEILDKASGQLYRYHLPSSKYHAVYTHRPDDSANDKNQTPPPMA
jgi:hypothetical protein